MRKFLAGLLGMVLCVQTVYGIPVRAADVFEPGERPKAMQDVIRQEDPEQTNRDNSGNLTGLELSAESAVIMEASGGQVLLEKNADEKKPPASVTKVMTLLLIFDALADGTITPDTEVTTSEYAASMGGSQVFLEAGEKQTVDTMIKCIAVASANDACVAMAEKIAGSEPAFVEKMNQRSAGLGMTNTHFVNCNGLDTEGHLTTARDIALMSRELITKYPQIEDYSTIWMGIIGSVFAILVVKQLFGGLGQNFMNPALGARCFLLISFTGRMTSFVYDGVSGATPLATIRANIEAGNAALDGVNSMDMLIGNIAGTIGETSVIAIVIGAIFLILMGVIDLRIPGTYIVTFVIFVGIFGHIANPNVGFFDPQYITAHLCGGGLMLGAWFMATDYVTSPITPKGQFVYGIILGVLTGLFRLFGGSAEGVSYAIIISNLLVPLIERVTLPKPFGKGGEK